MQDRDDNITDIVTFALSYLSIREYANWIPPCYPELKLLKTKSPAVEVFCELYEAGSTYPTLDNLRAVVTICSDFIDGRFDDWAKLHEVRDGLERDFGLIRPYDEKIGMFFTGILGEEIGPIGPRDANLVKFIDRSSFAESINLIDYVEKNTDESGCVLISPDERKKIRGIIDIFDTECRNLLRPEP